MLLVLSLMFSGLCQGQNTPHAADRHPASYIPDDDLIVKPVQNELSFYQQYVASDRSQEVITTRNQIRIWNENQSFADQYGLDSSLAGSSFFVPTPEEKWEYFKDRYFRHLRRKGEQPLKDMPKNWYQEFRASNEVDTIDEIESRFKRDQVGSGESKLPKSMRSTEVSLLKELKFIFQPRLDQGLVIVGLRSPSVYARAWVGVNGETEFNIQQNVDSIGFRAMFNYYATSGKYFVSLDQRILPNFYARLTATREPDQITQTIQELRNFNGRDEQLMLLYATQF